MSALTAAYPAGAGQRSPSVAAHRPVFLFIESYNMKYLMINVKYYSIYDYIRQQIK